MSQRVDLSQYFTRRQSDARYFRPTVAPAAPTDLTCVGHGVFASDVDQLAYVEVALTDPAAPDDVTTPEYVRAYVFEVCFEAGPDGDTKTVTRSFLLTKNDTLYRLSDLPCNTPITITASTVDFLGQRSVPSVPLVVTTDADVVPPAAPEIEVAVLATGALITLHTLNLESDFNHYELWRGRGYVPGTPATWGVVPTKVLDFVSTLVQDVAVPETQTDWYYFVCAIDVSGNSAPSLVHGPLALSQGGQDAPPTPALLGADDDDHDGVITFRFTALTQTEAPTLSKYRIWRRHSGVWVLLDTIGAVAAVASNTPVTYLDTRAVNGETYYYAVSAVNNVSDESPYEAASTVHATASDQCKPASVTGLLFVGRPGGVDLLWPRSSSPDVLYYRLRYKIADGYQTPENAILVTGTTYTIFGLTQAISELAYVLTVELVACDGLNESDPFEHTVEYAELYAGYRPADNQMPWIPQNQTATPNPDGTAQITWDAPNIPDLAGYQIDVQERRDGEDAGDWKLLVTLMDSTPGTKQFDDVGLEPYNFNPVRYRYRVRAIDNSGNISPLNLLADPGFEESPLAMPWERAVTPLPGGRTGNTAPATWHQDLSQVVSVQAGKTYTLSGHLKQYLTAGVRGTLQIHWLNCTHDVFASVSPASAIASDTWQRLHVGGELLGKAPVGAVGARCQFTGDPTDVDTAVLWDDVQFEENVEVSPYSAGVTAFFKAADTEGPLNYLLGLTTLSGLGFIGLRWTNPVAGDFVVPNVGKDVDYINGVFEVWRTRDLEGVADETTWAKIDEVPANNDGAGVGYDDNSPDESTAVTYHYKLRARDRFGNVGTWLGTPVCDTSKTLNDFLPVPPAPDQPTVAEHVTNTHTDGTLTVTWKAQYQVAGYRVWRRVAGTDMPVLIHSLRAVDLETPDSVVLASYTDLDPVNGTRYEYAVTSYNATGGESDLSVYSAAVTSHDRVGPTNPTDIRITGGLGSMRIDWTPVLGATQYRIEYAKDLALAYVTAGTAGTSPTYTIFGLHDAPSALTHFKVRITAIDAALNESAATPSDVISPEGWALYVPGDGYAPAAPEGWDAAAAVASDGTVLLRWDASPSGSGLSYLVEQQEGMPATQDQAPDPDQWEQLAFLQRPITLQYRASGLEPWNAGGKQYLFRVRTVDASGQVSAPDEGLVTPWLKAADTAGPGGYAGLGFDAKGALGAIGLTWVNAPGTVLDDPMPDYFQCVYEVWRATDVGFSANVQKIAEVPGTNDGKPNRYDDLSPTDNLNMTFWYRLKPRDRFGNVGNYLGTTTTATSKTTADMLGDGLAPTTPAWTPFLQIVANDDGTVTLNWQEATTITAETGFDRKDLAGYNIWRKPKFQTGSTVIPTTVLDFERIGSVTAHWGHGSMTWTELPPMLWQYWHYAITAFDTQLEESMPRPNTIPYDPFHGWWEVMSKDVRKPLRPTNFHGNGTLGGIILSWNPSPSPGVTRYEAGIEDGILNGRLWVASQLYQTTGTTITIPLPIGPPRALLEAAGQTVFKAYIKAIRETGDGTDPKQSDVVWLTSAAPYGGNPGLELSGYLPVDLTPPAPPTRVHTTSLTPYGVSLSWDPSPSPDVNRYIVEVQMGTGWYTVGTAVAGSVGCHVAGLQQLQTFYFRVSSIDNANNASGMPENFRANWYQYYTYAVGDVVLYTTDAYPIDPKDWVYTPYRCKALYPNGSGYNLPGPPNATYWEAPSYGYSRGILIPQIQIPNDPPPDMWFSGYTSVPDTDHDGYAKIHLMWNPIYVDALGHAVTDISRYQIRRNQNDAGMREIGGQTSSSYDFLTCEYNQDYVFQIRAMDMLGLPSVNWSPVYTAHTCNPPALPNGPTLTVTHTVDEDANGVYGCWFHIAIQAGYVKPANTDHYNIYISNDGGATYTQYQTAGTPDTWNPPYTAGNPNGPTTYLFKAKCVDVTGQVNKSNSLAAVSDVCPQAQTYTTHSNHYDVAHDDHDDYNDAPHTDEHGDVRHDDSNHGDEGDINA